MSQISFGTITIVDTTDIQRFYVEYAKSNSSAAAPTTGWSQNRPTWQNGTYIWQRTVIKKQDVAQLEYGSPVCITGEKGQTGQQGIQGNTGKGISSIVTTYCNYGTGTPAANYSGWNSSVPAYDKNKPNYWVKTTVNYTTGNPSVTIYKDLGITEAAQKANLAASVAQTAESNSLEAISIAGSKNKIYYSTSFPTNGSYIDGDTLFYKTSNGTIMYVYDSSYNDNTSGHWRQQQFEENAISDLAITNAKIKNLSGDKITANTIASDKIVSHSITAVQLATNAIKSTNYNAGTAPYSLTGTFLDLSNGNIFTPNFGVNNDSTDNIDNGAYIKGTIQAYDGKIGSDNNNYWYIGNYFDYNQGQSAMIRSHGTAAIQLGDSSTWRLSTNRIHTAWNDDSTSGQAFRLHYLSYDGKYWDSGLHVPTSATDKLLYIRNAPTSTSLENLQNDIDDNSGGNYWNYQFYLTNDGSVYAKNIYIVDENGNTTQIGGTDGVYLLKSGGTITGNLTVNGTLTATASQANALTHTLSINGQSWTGSSNLTINTLGTAYGGTGNTSYTAGGVVYADNSSPKKLLSTAAGTSGYLLKSGGTGAPTWVDPGTLTVAAAAKDGDGNVIKTTYLKLTGGNVTGPVSFGDSVSIDDLSAGTLVVTGNASFTNNIQANTINGVTVGSNPKFTDTVTTISTEGNGNAITAIESTNGILKAIKGATFLMNISSSQVTSALGYTPYNATNPNGYTSNTGTVTSVAASGSGGITISGSPITTSGTLTIGLNLSTAINGLGEGTSPANRNDYAVVQYAGGGTTTTSYHRRKLSNVFAALNSSDITTALGFTPYNSTNPNGYTSNTGTVTSVRVQASSPLQSSTSTAQSSSLNTTISFVNQNANVVLAGPSSGDAAVPAFRALVAADIPSLTKSKISDFPTTWALSSVTGADDLKAIEALTGTSGFLKKTAANTWSLDTTSYVPTTRKVNGHALSSDVTVTKGDVGLGNVTNYQQITGIGQGANGSLRVWTGDPTSTSTDDYADIPITITAYEQSTVKKAVALDLSAAVGSTSKPVYFKADGKPYEIGYTIEKSVPSNAVFTDTTYTFDGTYNASTNKAATVSTVTNAINALDGGTIGTGGKGKTITSLSQSNGNVSATFADISITKSQISDFPTSMTPTAHTHDDRYYTESEIDNKFTALTNTTTQINNIKFYSGTCSAGKTYIGWIKIASVTMSSNNYIGENGYDIGIYRNYNSPAAESYNIKVNTGWGNASIVQLNGKAGTQIIEKFRLVKDNTNHIWYFEIYVNPTYSTYENLVNFRIQSWNNVELNLLNTVQTEADSDLQIVSTIDLKPQGIVSNSNFYGNLIGTADIANSVAWSNITSKPINFITNVGALNTNGWKTLGGRNTQSSIAISYASSNSATWNSGAFSSSIVFGCQDTKGMVDVGYTSPVVTFGGGSVSGSTDDAPKWYFKLNGTSGQSYTFPDASKTLAATDGSNASGSWGISITGNATTATSATSAGALTNKTLDSLTLNSTAGTFSFQGGGAPWDGTDWVGLQVGSNDDKFQIHALNGTTLEYRQNDSGGTNSNWGDWYSLLSAGNYTDYTVTKTGTGASGSWGISITGNAATATSATSATTASAVGTSTIWLYAQNSNEINFGGTHTETTLYIGYRATGSRPVPTKFVFGGSTGTADLQAKTVYLGSGTTSYITSTQYTGNAATATKATQDGNGNVITAKYVTIDTTQTISGRKTFNDLAAVTFKPSSGTDNCSINYDAALGALVFSF